MVRILCSLFAIISLALGGCMSITSGGAPPQSFSIDNDLKQLETHFAQVGLIENYYQAPSANARNQFITARLVLMNIHYIEFIRKMNGEKQFVDSATDILVMSLNLAGASVDSTSVKTALAAISAGVTGSKIAIDKYYYYEKTIAALIAAMNAQRKQALQSLIEGMDKDLQQYPFETALADLDNYYYAGTFMAAIQAIQVDAGVKEQKADQAIRNAIEQQYGKRLTPAENSALVTDLTKRLQKVQADSINGPAQATAVLKKYQLTHPDLALQGDSVIQLTQLVLDTTHNSGSDAQQLQKAFADAGVSP